MSNNEDIVAALRGETKARKALSKLGLKPVEGYTRVVMKRNKGGILVIPVAEIFKSATSETYVIYGASHSEDPAQQQYQMQQQAAQMAQQEMNSQAANDALLAADNTIEEVEEDDDAEVDEEGLNAADIEVIINQSKCSRGKAAKALRANNGDVIAAIMSI